MTAVCHTRTSTTILMQVHISRPGFDNWARSVLLANDRGITPRDQICSLGRRGWPHADCASVSASSSAKDLRTPTGSDQAGAGGVGHIVSESRNIKLSQVAVCRGIREHTKLRN